MLEIEIVESNIIEGGVEIFARAWRDGVQIGFGKDGSVDIERFRIFNPPVLVLDAGGDVLSFVQLDPDDLSLTKEVRYREDPEEALLQTLEHNISVMSTRGSENIVANKVGNTTSTFYPDASPETTTVDGWLRSETASAGWDPTHDATTGSLAIDNGTTIFARSILNTATGACDIIRSMTLFDTSVIGTDAISSATYSLYGDAILANADNDGDDFITVVESFPASNTALTTADFDQVGDAINNPTEAIDAGNRLDIGSMSTVAYNDFAFNSTGIGMINKSGVTKLGFREGHDVLDSPVASGAGNSIRVFAADQTGTTQDPKLVVEHAAGGGGRRIFNIS